MNSLALLDMNVQSLNIVEDQSAFSANIWKRWVLMTTEWCQQSCGWVIGLTHNWVSDVRPWIVPYHEKGPRRNNGRDFRVIKMTYSVRILWTSIVTDKSWVV